MIDSSLWADFHACRSLQKMYLVILSEKTAKSRHVLLFILAPASALQYFVAFHWPSFSHPGATTNVIFFYTIPRATHGYLSCSRHNGSWIDLTPQHPGWVLKLVIMCRMIGNVFHTILCARHHEFKPFLIQSPEFSQTH